jgi:hypothetical protein
VNGQWFSQAGLTYSLEMPYVKPGCVEVNDLIHFKKSHQLGTRTSISGIYRCTGCEYEIARVAGENLPLLHDEDFRHDQFKCDGLTGWTLVALPFQKPR